MSDRAQNGVLAGLLVLTLVLVGFSLRSQDEPATPTEANRPTTTSSAPSTPTASPSPSASAGGTVAFLGDSMAEGDSASAPAKRWTSLVAAELGLKEVNLAHGGTGYLRSGKPGSCGEQACQSFEDSVADVVKAKPTVVVVSGGGNDTGMPSADVRAAVTDTLTSLRKGLPDAKIYAVTPWWDQRPEPETLDALVTAVETAAKEAKVTYLDTGQPLVGKPDLMAAGSNDPDDDGHAALAAAVTKAIDGAPSN
ncbi:lysophospholipase L1-like esterase [Knoellia remsis]|uniref:Lysophospholipase L1-like esterase n=1 Tax=Knoellia remsis TaxID=407159 RepID=A0A2T0TSH4_9MICO|nr:SGNH/GDSL hydrolase family protein [Knoellia remsis]PRY48609.1 lysophospholipase L1-like esterase [Knoellia remsis]